MIEPDGKKCVAVGIDKPPTFAKPFNAKKSGIPGFQIKPTAKPAKSRSHVRSCRGLSIAVYGCGLERAGGTVDHLRYDFSDRHG